MCILQDRVIDKLIIKKKNQPIVIRLFVISYDIFHILQQNLEAVNYCHKIICYNKEVIASTCLLQYVEFIITRSLCCINLLLQSLLQRIATTFSTLQ